MSVDGPTSTPGAARRARRTHPAHPYPAEQAGRAVRPHPGRAATQGAARRTAGPVVSGTQPAGARGAPPPPGNPWRWLPVAAMAVIALMAAGGWIGVNYYAPVQHTVSDVFRSSAATKTQVAAVVIPARQQARSPRASSRGFRSRDRHRDRDCYCQDDRDPTTTATATAPPVTETATASTTTTATATTTVPGRP